MAGQLSHLSVQINAGNNKVYSKAAAAEYVMAEH